MPTENSFRDSFPDSKNTWWMVYLQALMLFVSVSNVARDRGPKANPISQNTQKKHRVYMNIFKKFARTFAFFPVKRVRNSTKLFRKKLVQMNSFIWGGLFFGWIFLLWRERESGRSLWFPTRGQFIASVLGMPMGTRRLPLLWVGLSFRNKSPHWSQARDVFSGVHITTTTV